MEILFLAPFAIFWGILQEARQLAQIYEADESSGPSRIHHVPKKDSWVQDVERFDLMLTPHRRKTKKSSKAVSDVPAAPAGTAAG